jgi:Lamin Tail Domain/PKD domain
MRTAGLFLLAAFLAVFVSFLPVRSSAAHAAVLFTEIMYDVSGTDTGREWVEITNTGTSPEDVSGYRFFEANVNHALTKISGSSVLAAGSSAVIADDAAKFKIDWPSFAGTLFDSSFSLSNTGEPLALKDSSLNVLDSITYDPSLGAGGDGNSLQLSGGAFSAAAPTPGTYAGAAAPLETPTAQTANAAPQTVASAPSVGSSTYTPPPSNLSLDIGGNRDALVEAPLHLSARVTTKGGTLDANAQVIWSFGDGSSLEGAVVEKIYRYEGTYLVMVDAIDGSAKTHDEIVVTVKKIQVPPLIVTKDGITITNDSPDRLDLSGWRLMSDTGMFRIPVGTSILPKSSVLFPFTITNMPFTFDAALMYPDGVIAAHTRPSEPVAIAVAPITVQPAASATSYEKIQAVDAITSPLTKVQKNEDAVLAPAATVKPVAAGAAPKVSVKKVPEPAVAAVLPAAKAATQAAAVESDSATTTSSAPRLLHSPWTLGFLGVMTLAGGAFILL